MPPATTATIRGSAPRNEKTTPSATNHAEARPPARARCAAWNHRSGVPRRVQVGACDEDREDPDDDERLDQRTAWASRNSLGFRTLDARSGGVLIRHAAQTLSVVVDGRRGDGVRRALYIPSRWPQG